MSKEVIVFSNPQNEATNMYVRHYEGPAKFGKVKNIGSVAFHYVGDRQDRHFFIAIESNEGGHQRTALVETDTAAEAVEAIRDDAALHWLLEAVDYEETTAAA